MLTHTYDFVIMTILITTQWKLKFNSNLNAIAIFKYKNTIFQHLFLPFLLPKKLPLLQVFKNKNIIWIWNKI